MDEAEIDKTNLLENQKEFSEKSKPRTKKRQRQKKKTFKSVNALYERRGLILNAFRSVIFPRKKARRRIKNINS